MGKLNATYGARGAAPSKETLQGPVGFVVD
jgi:hypothetical protein